MSFPVYLESVHAIIRRAKSAGLNKVHFPLYTPSTADNGPASEFELIKARIVAALRHEGLFVSRWVDIEYMKAGTSGRFQEIFVTWEESEVAAATDDGYDFS